MTAARPVTTIAGTGIAGAGRLILLATLVTLAAAIALLPLRLVAAGAGAAAAAMILLRWPWLALLPLAVLLPITSGLRLGPLSVTDLLLAAIVGLWFADGARRRTLRLMGSPVIALTGVYVAVMTVSALGAADFGEAGREVIKWLELLVLLLVGPALLSPRQAPWLAAALVLGAVLQAVYGLYQFVFAVGPDYFILLGRFMRAYGSFGQPNPFGGYLGLTLPVALSLGIWAWAAGLRASAARPQALAWAAYYSAATAIIAAGLLASWSRGAWLGAAAGVLVVLVLRSRLAAILSGVAALLMPAALLLGAFSPTIVPAPVAARLQDIPAYFGLGDVLSQPVTDENFSVLERLAHWAAAQRMWEQAPWLGVGPGNYAQVYPQVRLPQWEEPLGHAHNVYWNVAAETGLAGLAAYLGLFGVTAIWLWRRLRRAAQGRSASERWRAALLVGILGVLVHLSVHNVVDNLFVQGMLLQVGLWLTLAHIDHTARTEQLIEHGSLG
jgi:putative inorganic carbon (HCO3(-)) transporter